MLVPSTLFPCYSTGWMHRVERSSEEKQFQAQPLELGLLSFRPTSDAHTLRMRRSLSVATNGRARSTGPPSPTLTATTNASVLDLGQAGYARAAIACAPLTLDFRPQRVITRGDLRSSAQAYNELLHAATAFRAALASMSKASAAFAHATEKCSR